MLGRWDEADELLGRLSYDELDDELIAEVAIARAGLALISRGRLDHALDILGPAAERLTGVRKAGVLAQCSYLALSAGRPALAIDYAMAALAEAGPDTGVRVQALAVATLAWALQGRTSLAIGLAELALPCVPEVVTTDPSPVALNAAGVMPVAYAIALGLAGRLGEASAVADAMMAAASTSDFRILYAITAALDGRMALWRGLPASARRRGEEGLAIAETDRTFDRRVGGAPCSLASRAGWG